MEDEFDVEDVTTRESFDSVSTENSDDAGGVALGANRSFVPCGVGATVQVQNPTTSAILLMGGAEAA